MFRIISTSIAGRSTIDDKDYASFDEAERAAKAILESPRISEVSILATVVTYAAEHKVTTVVDNRESIVKEAAKARK